MAFIQVTRKAGRLEYVNVDSIVSVRDTPELATIMLTTGVDFQVTESYDDLRATLVKL